MKIYLDSDFCCHLTNDGHFQLIETDFFKDKCQTYIEGYRFIPVGKSWTRTDGIIFHGEMITPIEDPIILNKAQSQYEEDESIHLAEIGALIEEIYNEDLEVIG